MVSTLILFPIGTPESLILPTIAGPWMSRRHWVKTALAMVDGDVTSVRTFSSRSTTHLHSNTYPAAFHGFRKHGSHAISPYIVLHKLISGCHRRRGIGLT